MGTPQDPEVGGNKVSIIPGLEVEIVVNFPCANKVVGEIVHTKFQCLSGLTIQGTGLIFSTNTERKYMLVH